MNTPAPVALFPAALRFLKLVALGCSFCLPAVAQDTGLVGKMAANEVAARRQELHYAYLAEEMSARTGGHLWREKVVETDDGPLRRLLAIDGKALDDAAQKAEAERIADLVRNPDALRQANASHKDDEVRATELLSLLPKAFLLTPAGVRDGCTQFVFRPNPNFEPSSYEERVAHAMTGTVSLKQPMNRLCTLDGTISEPVEFGFGMLGKIAQGGRFSLGRAPVDGTHWKSMRISVHIEGRILMLKSLTKQQEITRRGVVLVPEHLSLEQAARLTQP